MTNTFTDTLSWETFGPRFQALQEAELTTESVGAWLQAWSDIAAELGETAAWLYRGVTEDTADAEAEHKFLLYVEEIMPQAQVAQQALKEKLLALEGWEPGADTASMVRRFRAEAAIFRDENVPLLSELTRLGNEYDKIVGGMTVAWEGEELTVPQVEQHLEAVERDTRERAWRGVVGRYLLEREQLNALYLKMVGLRQQVARNAGFDSFREYQWQVFGRFDYTPEDARTFQDAIEHEVVPVARALYEQLREELGVEALCPWDTRAEPEGTPLAPFTEVNALEEGCQRIFDRVDPDLGQQYMRMRDGFLDLASRANKAPGGYCEGFPVSGNPYIFMNAVGTHRDLVTMLHEGGHAFHFIESSQQQPLIWQHNGPMEFCEVASMSMELLAAPYLAASEGGFYDEADARRAYRHQIVDGSVFFLPYMAIVDAFQHWVYDQDAEALDAATLDEKWGELWDRFMAGQDWSGLEAEKVTGWHRKGHIFTAPFYYIEYGLAQVGALQVWRNALQDQARAVADYRTALALGDTRALPELFAAAGARFAFDRITLRELMGLVQEQVEVLGG